MYIFAFKDQANTNKYSNSLKIYPDGEFLISDLLYHFLKLLFRFHYSFKNISPYCNCSSHSNKFFNILQVCQEAKNCGILAVPPSRIQEHFMDSSTLKPPWNDFCAASVIRTVANSFICREAHAKMMSTTTIESVRKQFWFYLRKRR